MVSQGGSFVNVVAIRKAGWCVGREKKQRRVDNHPFSFLFLALGTSSSRLGGSLGGADDVGVPDGLGHTKSLASSRQNSRIRSKRYCWRSRDSPVGWINHGRSVASGFHLGSLRKRCSSVAPECSRSLTMPGEDVLK